MKMTTLEKLARIVRCKEEMVKVALDAFEDGFINIMASDKQEVEDMVRRDYEGLEEFYKGILHDIK